MHKTTAQNIWVHGYLDIFQLQSAPSSVFRGIFIYAPPVIPVKQKRHITAIYRLHMSVRKSANLAKHC